MPNDMPSREQRLQWFLDARFGLFVHWGCYSVLGRGEQIMSRDLIPLAEYDRLARDFCPAGDWAPRLAEMAVGAGAGYVVLTTRHHDGYCLFETETHDFNAARTGPGRDLVAEYAEALRSAGLRVGFYYSIMNWRWPGFWEADQNPDDLPRMVDEIHAQVRELMTNYGEIDILWYDVSAVPGLRSPGTWSGKSIEQTAAEFYRSSELNEMVRRLQPQILLNNRGGGEGDFSTPEQNVSTQGEARAWETCMTLNYRPNWGYLKHSMADKTAGEVLYNLVDAVRLGGNFLFNVGPNRSGHVQEREAAVLRQVGRWMRQYGASAIRGTRPAGIYDMSRGWTQGPCFHYGMFTCKDSTAWLTLFYYPGDPLIISKIGPGIRAARILGTDRDLRIEALANSRWELSGMPEDPPDPLAPVVEIEFEAPPFALTDAGAGWLFGAFAEQ